MKPDKSTATGSGLWRGGVLIGLFAVFALDLVVPLGIAYPILYALVVLLTAFSRQPRLLLVAAVLAIVFTLLAFWLQHPPQPGILLTFVIANRILGIVAILACLALGLALVRQNEALAKAMKTARQADNLYQMAARIGRFGGWSVDLSTRRVHWTGEVARLHGLEPGYTPDLDEAIEFYAPEERAEVQEAVRQCIEDGTGYDCEWQLRLPEGRRRWVRAIGEPVHDAGGNIIGLHGALQDIDARKRAEQEAQISRTRLWQLADAMPLIVWTADKEGYLEFFNQFTFDYTGVRDKSEIVGERWLEKLHPDDRESTRSTWVHSVQTGEPYSTRFRIRRRDGSFRWFQTSGSPIKGADGKIEGWFGACIDIEEQKQLADRHEDTLEAITDAFYALDHDWRFVYLNKQGEAVSGTSREDVLGKSIWERFPEVVGTPFETHYREAMQSGKPVQFIEYYEPFDVWFEVRAFPSSEGLSVFLRDITAQHRAEDHLRQAQRLESVGQLTGGLAHDFNNLLTVVIGNAELLSELTEKQPELQQLVDMIGSAAQRGSDLTRRLLAFARKQALEPVTTDINRLIADMEPLLRHALGEQIEIEFARAGGLWKALIDSGQLEDTLLNLCLNARDAMPDGGRLTIETFNARLDADYCEQHEEVEPGQYVAVAVSDTGHGMDEETTRRAFEPFFTRKKSDEGTGLGLAMVYGFVKQSEGHVKIYTEPERGTTVRVYLPRTHQKAELPGPLTGSVEGGSETVLLVEDEELVRQYARQQLEKLGYDVIEAADGHEALAKLDQSQHVDLLFTDVVMPAGMSGRELADEATRRQPGLKVLYTSGYTENAIVHHGRLDPGIQLLSKPWRRDQLARALRRALDG
jgi:PAS domain S-box-containing protein